MSAPALRWLACGAADLGPWAVFTWAGSDATSALARHDGGTGAAPGTGASLTAEFAAETWTVHAAGTALTAEPAGDELTLVADGLELSLGLCTVALAPVAGAAVTGAVADGGGGGGGDGDSSEAPAIPGIRGELRAELGSFGSLRTLFAHFAEGASYGAVALRPRKAKGHDRDLVLAALLDSGGGTLVEDPRLSLTVGPAGEPVRAGMELWLEPEDDGEDQYPHRVAGERLAAGGTVHGAALRGGGSRFGWHGRGREGSGGAWVLQRP